MLRVIRCTLGTPSRRNGLSCALQVRRDCSPPRSQEVRLPAASRVSRTKNPPLQGDLVHNAHGLLCLPLFAYSVVVRASAENRRSVLSGLAAGAAAVALAPRAVQAMELTDDRKAKLAGFDIIYEARDLDLDQDTRDGLAQARKDLNFTKNRIKESEKRIDTELEPLVKKNYW